MKTQTEALIVRNHYPQKTKVEALSEAMKLSKGFPHLFVYVCLCTTTGTYCVDLIGFPYSDFKIEATILNQQVNL